MFKPAAKPGFLPFRSFQHVAISTIAALATAAGWADISLSPLLGDHLVLQRGRPIPVWGSADPGERVEVALAGLQATTVTDAAGRWRVELPALEARDSLDLVVTGHNTVTVHDVAIGEVWICSGQSNMEMALEGTDKAWGGVQGFEKVIATGANPAIRQFRLARTVAPRPLTDMKGEWVPATRDRIGTFSAVAYFFARRLQHRLGVPVGLIVTSWGGTPAEAWTSAPSLAAEPALRPLLENWDRLTASYPTRLEIFRKDLSAWEPAAAAAEGQGRPVPPPPAPPVDPRSDAWRPSGLFNGMIAPLLPMTFAGVIWYQGESNSSRAHEYRTLFPAMIRDWRKAWGGEDFPFLFVQIAPFLPGGKEIGRWAELRESQAVALAEPRTAMVVTLDIGNPFDVHPRNKEDVGLRLARAAEAVAYGKSTAYSGPIFHTMKVEPMRVRLLFTSAQGGLVAKGGPLRGFEVAGSDQQFGKVPARIRGSEVLLDLPAGVKVEAVRYGWADAPVCNLFNRAGLPASSFRTDAWPIASPVLKPEAVTQ
jgi:sialate O-acetylesterase